MMTWKDWNLMQSFDKTTRFESISFSKATVMIYLSTVSKLIFAIYKNLLQQMLRKLSNKTVYSFAAVSVSCCSK